MRQELVTDLISQKTLLAEINTMLKKQTCGLSTSINEFQYKILEKNKIIEELREDKKVLSEVVKRTPHERKSLRNITIMAVLAISVSIFVSHIIGDLSYNQNSNSTPLKTQYVIEDLKGDTVATWKSWNLGKDQVLNVNIINANKISKDKLEVIKGTILEEKSIQIDDSLLHKGPSGTTSTYYLGWQGALENISDSTKFHPPTKFKIVESPSRAADITIELSNLENADGYSGYTKSMTDGNQIIQSSIIIYNVDTLVPQQLGAIVRHEFGHALGLAHSTAPEDLMHDTIQTEYPFISQCDIDAITGLYNDYKSSQVVCEK